MLGQSRYTLGRTQSESPISVVKDRQRASRLSPIWEVNEKTNILFTTGDSMGPFAPNFVGMRGEFIKKNRAAVVDFLEDFIRVVRWYYDPANRDASIKIVAEASKTPEEVLRRYIFTKEDNFRSMDAMPDLKVIQSNMQAQFELGFTRQQMRTGWLVPTMGNTYSGSSPIGLTAILDVAKPGQRILMVSYGSGAGSDAFIYQVTDRITSVQGLAPSTVEIGRAHV